MFKINIVYLFLILCCLNPWTLWNSWSFVDWCPWPALDYSSSSDTQLRSLSLSAVIAMVQAVPNMCAVENFPEMTKLIAIQFAVQYSICPGKALGLLPSLLRFWMCLCPCWLDITQQTMSAVSIFICDNCNCFLSVSDMKFPYWP